MATTPSSFKVFTNRLFGSYKDTETVESAQKKLETEFEDLATFAQSNDWIRYQELKDWVSTKQYLKTKQEVEALTFKKSSEYTAEQELKRIASKPDFKNYLKIHNSETPKLIAKMKESGLIDEFDSLKHLVDSADYKKNRSTHKKENSAEYKKELRYNELKSNADLKKYLGLIDSKPVKDYISISSSNTLNRYNELKQKVESPEFIERKKYLLSKNKFEQSADFQKLQEFKKLESSEKIKWYIKTKDSRKFDELKQWTVSFHDDFDGKSVDNQRWLTKFFWGDALINKAYSFASDGQCYTEGNNLEVKNSVLRIITRKEKADGLAWDTKFGFMPKTFNYTSGVINTGHIYRQSEGKIEAKVKLSCATGISHAFYLVGDKMLPELDIFLKSDSKENSVSGAYFWTNGSAKVHKSAHSISGLKLGSKFYILGIEWDSKNIVWTINGTPYKVEKNTTPNTPLYLVFASGVKGNTDESKLPAYMEIDWVKCWKRS
ncbi:MAG: glycoside hydrolase family 16 protein [Bacteroidales bacterium]|nr:glycoside hydrolase family 16 protein [Bacteroidales bacterium]